MKTEGFDKIKLVEKAVGGRTFVFYLSDNFNDFANVRVKYHVKKVTNITITVVITHIDLDGSCLYAAYRKFVGANQFLDEIIKVLLRDKIATYLSGQNIRVYVRWLTQKQRDECY